MPFELSHKSYGKSAVRLTKVVRRGVRHELFEINAAIQLEGDFEPAYRDGDNRNVIATDSIKNTVYVLAKENEFDSVERFALILGRHFVATYPQVTRATIELTQTAWQRIAVGPGALGHDHAFTSAGPQLRFAKTITDRANVFLSGGVRDLLVLKTTASEWRDFVVDRYRTLPDTRDRIMTTSIDADWPYRSTDGIDFNAAHDAITNAILRTFATQHSLGVQQTLMAMGEAALGDCDAIDVISFELPNKHRIPVNLKPFGLAFENDIFVATDEPYGLIKGTVTRSARKS